MQYGMIIDLERCVGCHACTIACRAEWEVPVDFYRNWVFRMGPSMVGDEIASTYYPGLCNHCTDPVCVPECPADTEEMTFTNSKTGETTTMEVAATWKDPFDGTVQIDKNRCIGCGEYLLHPYIYIRFSCCPALRRRQKLPCTHGSEKRQVLPCREYYGLLHTTAPYLETLYPYPR